MSLNERFKRLQLRPYYRLSRGSYMQPAFEKSDVRLIIYMAIVQVLGRMYDYLTPNNSTPGKERLSTLELAENVYPLPLWGGFIAIGVAFLLVGLIQRRHVVVWLGHATLTAVYVMLFIALFVPTVIFTPFDNWRTFTTLLLPMLIQILLLMRTGPKPVRPKHAVPLETVGGEDSASC